jgi:putative serine protease PepD
MTEDNEPTGAHTPGEAAGSEDGGPRLPPPVPAPSQWTPPPPLAPAAPSAPSWPLPPAGEADPWTAPTQPAAVIDPTDPGFTPGPITAETPASPSASGAGAASGPPTAFAPFPPPPPGGSPPPPGAGSAGSSGSDKNRRWIGVAVVAALIGGGVGAGVTALADNGNGSSDNITIHEGTADPGAAVLSGNVTIPELVKKVIPAVVSIDVKTRGSEDEGTGMIISSSGEVVTNNHVIEAFTNANGSGTITVTEYGQKKADPATTRSRTSPS